MQLLVTIDTEEDNAWRAGFRASGHTVENTRGIERFQRLCEDFRVRPTYLIDTPIAEDARSVEMLTAFQHAGQCEVGAHLHPWCAPPFGEPGGVRESFLCNLPADVQRDKLARLTDTIEQRTGRRPTSFRAGRYGLDMVGARILADLGYEVDSSVIPFTSYAAEEGPDFSHAPFRPYYLDAADFTQPHDAGFLLEVPVTVGYNRHDFLRSNRIHRLTAAPVLKQLRLRGFLDRLGILRRIKLSPEQADASEMQTLVDIYHAQGQDAVVLMFHSSSLVAGGSPYVPSETEFHRFYEKLNAIFRHCVETRHMRCETLTEFARQYRSSNAACVA